MSRSHAVERFQRTLWVVDKREHLAPHACNWAEWTFESEQNDSSSFFALYRTLLAERHANPALGAGTMTWNESSDEVLDFSREPGFRCIVNFGA